MSGDDLPCAAFTFSFMEASIGTRREFRTTLSGMIDRRVFGATDMSLETDKAGAEIKAMRRVRDNLEREFRWISEGLATVDLRVEEVSFAPIIKMMKPDNKGHTFYVDP